MVQMSQRNPKSCSKSYNKGGQRMRWHRSGQDAQIKAAEWNDFLSQLQITSGGKKLNNTQDPNNAPPLGTSTNKNCGSSPGVFKNACRVSESSWLNLMPTFSHIIGGRGANNRACNLFGLIKHIIFNYTPPRALRARPTSILYMRASAKWSMYCRRAHADIGWH